MNIIFENESPQGSFGAKKKCEFLLLSPDSRKLLTTSLKRRHQPEMLSKTDRLIQQQIARYFSRLSAVTKIGLLMRSPSVNMNEEGEADAMI